MLRFSKIICMSVVCLIMLSGCSSKQEKVEQMDQLDQSKTDDKTEKKSVRTQGKKTQGMLIDT